MPSSLGFKKQKSSSSSMTTTAAAVPPPLSFQTGRTIPNENDDAATKVDAETSPTAPSSSSNPSQQSDRDELQTTTRTPVPNQNDGATDILTAEASTRASGFRVPIHGRDECPICFHILPLTMNESAYNPCCGKLICNGCIIGRQHAQVKESGYIIDGITPEDDQFMLIMEHWCNRCPFCRSKDPDDREGYVERVLNRINIRNDEDYTIALTTLGKDYLEGDGSLPQSIQKAEELFEKAYDLDNPTAAFHLFDLYYWHYPEQKDKKMEYLRRGDTLGNIECIQYLAKLEYFLKNNTETTRLSMKGTRMGDDIARDNLMECYKDKLLSKEDLAINLRAHQAINDEMKTVRREFARRFIIFKEQAEL